MLAFLFLLSSYFNQLVLISSDGLNFLTIKLGKAPEGQKSPWSHNIGSFSNLLLVISSKRLGLG
jgi:hypothetical protein